MLTLLPLLLGRVGAARDAHKAYLAALRSKLDISQPGANLTVSRAGVTALQPMPPGERLRHNS